MKEESANNQCFFGKKEYQPKPVAQTRCVMRVRRGGSEWLSAVALYGRYMPLEVEHRDAVQHELMNGVGPMLKLGHGDDLHHIGSATVTENETLYDHNVHRGGTKANALTLKE